MAVLKKSKNMDKAEFKKILESIDGSEDALKAYERKMFRTNFPNHT